MMNSRCFPFRGYWHSGCTAHRAYIKPRLQLCKRGRGMRQRPTLPGRLQPSTIGVLGLNFCVRNGNRWNPQAIATAKGELLYRAPLHPDNCI